MRPSRNAPLVAVLILLSPAVLYSQSRSPDAVWTRLGEPRVQTVDFEPAQGSGAASSRFGLNHERIGAILRLAPKEFTEQAENTPTIVTIPCLTESSSDFASKSLR